MTHLYGEMSGNNAVREKLFVAVDHGLNFGVATRVAEFLARFLAAKRTFFVLDRE